MINPQRIAFLCHPYHRGGVTRWMADAAIAYASTGWQVYFVTIAPIKEFHSAHGREYMLQLLSKEKNTVNIISAKAGGEFEFGTAEYRTYVYQKLLAQLPVGTPVILSDDASVWQAAAALHTSYPIIGVLHADEEQYYQLAEKYHTHVAALTSVSGRINRNTLARISTLNKDTLYTIPCGINLPKETQEIPGGNILQLVYVGRVSDYQKRTGDLPKICAQLAEKGMPFHLRIVGDGEAKATLQNTFIEQGLEQYVTFSGWLSQQEVNKHLSMSDVLLLTSDFEGMPIAMMEAFAAGCGVAGTRVSGIEDYEGHPLAHDCLSVFTIGDIADAVSKINYIAGIPVTMRRIAARKLAESEFSLQACLEKYAQVISGITMDPTPSVPPKFPPLKQVYSNLLSAARSIKVKLR